MKALLLDTCIWIDNFDGARPSTGPSQKLIDHALMHGISLLYSVASLQNIEYAIQAKLKYMQRAAEEQPTESSAASIRALTIAYLDNLTQIATCVGADGSDVWLARKLMHNHSDFEDCMVMAAMERSKADFFVTNDEKLIKHCPYPVMAPTDMLIYLQERNDLTL